MEELTWLPYTKRVKYPGMAPRDVEIWERFIEANPSAFDVVAYNVAVGAGTPLNTVVSTETGGDINRLYQRKIDVVGRAGGNTVVAEVKPRASTSSLGQVKGYATLYKRDFNALGVVLPLIITDELLPEMQELAKGEGVNVVVA